jgi:hypothetical protein
MFAKTSLEKYRRKKSLFPEVYFFNLFFSVFQNKFVEIRSSEN